MSLVGRRHLIAACTRHLIDSTLLYALHALLTGVSMAVTWGLGVHDGFSFSAGLIDYVINWNLATRPWAIIPIGLCFAAVYYAIFRFAITKFDLKTPGREPEEARRAAWPETASGCSAEVPESWPPAAGLRT